MCLLLAASVLLRVGGLARPLLGHFSSKSVLYAMIARNWATGRSSWLLPRVDCLCDGQRGLHLVDYPVAAWPAALGWKMFGGSLDVWGRATTVVFSVISIVLLYRLALRWHGRTAALGAAWALALSPASVIYGQSFMLEPSIVCFTLAAMLSLDRWAVDRRSRWLAAATIGLALAVWTKIYLVVLLVPLAAVLAWRRTEPARPLARGSLIALVLAALVAITPGLLWTSWVWSISRSESDTAAHVFYSLHTSAAVHAPGSALLLSPDFYRKLLDDFTGPALTPLGFVLALAGLAHPAAARYRSWLATCLLLVLLLPLKFYRLNYYDLVVLPPVCLLAGLGWQKWRSIAGSSEWHRWLVLGVAVALSLRWALVPGFVTPAEDRAVPSAAAAARALTEPGEAIATVHGTNFDLLYYCDRPGWALAIDDPRFDERLAYAQASGARLLVVAHVEALERHPAAKRSINSLPLVASGEDYQIFRLATPSQP